MRLLFVLLLLIFGFSQCKKENRLDRPLNVTLYNKTPKDIYSYIKGKWKFVYGKGGINASQMHYCEGCTVEFTADYKIISNTFFNANAKIEWQKLMGQYTDGDSTYVMRFKDDENAPVLFVIDKIINDTLIIHDFGLDAVFYHFVKF